MLLESDAEYLVMDFYDMGINFCTYENTMFATQANEFCQTALYRKYADKIGIGNLYGISTCLWYGYIDLSKYFMGDQNDWDNLNGAHFEREFYRETFDQIKRIIFGETDKRVYDEPDFFNPDRRGYEEDMKREFNVEYNLEILDVLMNNNDILWLNILDKLNSYAPGDSRVAELVT